MRLTQEERDGRNQEALGRATTGQSWINYPAIFEGLTARGIPETDILPRENVLTFAAWKAKGRFVRRGEKGVAVTTWIECSKAVKADDGSEKVESFKTPHRAYVFHVSQTEARG